MADQGEQYEKSWILHHLIGRMLGGMDLVVMKRRLIVVDDQIQSAKSMEQFSTGSHAEGIDLDGSDKDAMFFEPDVIVMCRYQDASIPPDSTNKTVLLMTDANSRPGYVRLELVNLGEKCPKHVMESFVRVRDVDFISSEIFLRSHADGLSHFVEVNIGTNGPASTLRKEEYIGSFTHDVDVVRSFRCNTWPREANEWVSRPRMHGWPNGSLRDQIVQDGCHLVPVGDKTSADTFLQWRISFTTAERKLIYSLTDVQFSVYGLLKYFLKQISDMLKQIIGNEDILSSYIIKTIIFHAVENTPESFWQEKYTFFCFMLCLKILITWVNAGYCPNYFIYCNNMFLGKVQGENQQKLLRFLTDLHDMKWECLSVGTFIHPPIGELLDLVRNGAWKNIFPIPTKSEMGYDMTIFHQTLRKMHCPATLPVALALLYESESDMDEFIAYVYTAQTLAAIGMEAFDEHTDARGNKEKYRSLRKSKKLITPMASVCTSPGLLTLATYHYQTGNYTKALKMCGQLKHLYVGHASGFEGNRRYEHLYCGRGYTLLHKCQQAIVSGIIITKNASQYFPSHLHLVLTKHRVPIPPLPYAVFLSFLCYHELNDIKRRDTALVQLRVVKYDVEQGGAKHWIVHTLLGICFEMVGDKCRALREYRCSLDVRDYTQNANPAMERIARLQHS